MTKTEARELKPIVRRRHDRLEEELKIRRDLLRQSAVEYLLKEKESEVNEFTAKLMAISVRHQALFDDAIELTAKMKEVGLKPDANSGSHYDENDNRIWLLIKEPNYSKATVDIYAGKKSLDEQIGNLYSEGLKAIRLSRDDLLDKLTLNLVDSEDAKDFISNLPTVDSYLPLPNGVPLTELLSGE